MNAIVTLRTHYFNPLPRKEGDRRADNESKS